MKIMSTACRGIGVIAAAALLASSFVAVANADNVNIDYTIYTPVINVGGPQIGQITVSVIPYDDGMTHAQTGVEDAAEFIVTPIDETNVWASYMALVDPDTYMIPVSSLLASSAILDSGDHSTPVVIENTTGRAKVSATISLPYTGEPWGFKVTAVYPNGQRSDAVLIQAGNVLPTIVSAPTCAADCVAAEFPVDPNAIGYAVTPTDLTAAGTTMRSTAVSTKKFVYGMTSPINVTGLNPAHKYRMSVTSLNSRGYPAGTQAVTTTPVVAKPVPAKPSAARITKVVVTNHRATVSGTAAGSTIIAYVITAADITRGSRDNQVYRGSKAVTVFTTLRHGDSYRFTISARNAAGTSATSAASKSYRL